MMSEENERSSEADKESDLLGDAIANPKNLGEMEDADAVGTVGSPDCGDMVRMWIKFGEKDGKKIIDKASFQSFGCQTAIAVASVATEMIKGKTVDEARELSSDDLSRPLGPLPPMKMHCGQLVESALERALKEDAGDVDERHSGGEQNKSGLASAEVAPTLADSMQAPSSSGGKIKIVKLQADDQ